MNVLSVYSFSGIQNGRVEYFAQPTILSCKQTAIPVRLTVFEFLDFLLLLSIMSTWNKIVLLSASQKFKLRVYL